MFYNYNIKVKGSIIKCVSILKNIIITNNNFKSLRRCLMKYLIKLFGVLIFFFSFFLKASVTYDLQFNPSDLNFETKDGFDIVSLEGTSFIDDLGKPMLPVKYLNLIIPQGTKAHSISLTINSFYQIPGSYFIYPTQPPVLTSTGKDTIFIPPDSLVYNTDIPYPYRKARIISTGNFAGSKIAFIAFYPLQYNPTSGKIILYTDVTITLTVRISDDINRGPIKRTLKSYRIYKKALYSIVDNNWDIPGYCWEPAVVENTSALKSKGRGTNYEYVVITADSLVDAFNPFIEWLTKKGISAYTKSVSEIVSEYPGGDIVSGINDDAGSIRQFLIESNEQELLQWALLGGDEDIVPIRYGFSENELIPVDLYFADMNGDWNCDLDTLYGEEFSNSFAAFNTVGKCNLPDTIVYDMTKNDDYAYIAEGKNGIQIVDISDSLHPEIVSSLTLSDSANTRAVCIKGNTLYIATMEDGLRIVNVSNPNSPQEIGNTPIGGISRDIDVLNDIAYIANYDSGLRTVDVSNPENPTVIDNFETPGYALGIRVKDTLTFIADSSGGLRVFNIKNPYNAFEIGYNDSVHCVMDVDVQDNFAYIADGPYNDIDNTLFQTIDISDPTHPILRGKNNHFIVVAGLYQRSTRVFVKDEYLYTIVKAWWNPKQRWYSDLCIYRIDEPDTIIAHKWFTYPYTRIADFYVGGIGARDPFIYKARSDSFMILLPFIGDSIDFYSEIYVGRIPGNKNKDIENWVEKVLSYERTPGNGDYNYLTKVFWSAGQIGRDAPKNLIPYFPNFFIHDTTLLEKRNPLFPTGEEVVDTMSHGFGNCNFYEHGAPDQFTVSSVNNYGDNPRHFVVSLDTCDEFFDNHSGEGCIVEIGNGLDSLTNENYYGWLYTVSCDVAAYDHDKWSKFDNYCGPCLATAFTTLENRGGPTFLGNTRDGYFNYSRSLHKEFLNALFIDSLYAVGVSEAISKASYSDRHKDYLCLSHDLFGCPEMPIWTDIPQNFLVSYPPFMKLQDSLSSISFDVEVSDTLGNPVNNAYVCLLKGEEVYKTKFTSSLGIATFYISPQTEGWMYVTVTKPNYIPFEDSSYVIEELVNCVTTTEATYPNAQKKVRYLEQSNNDIGLIYSSDEYSILATGSPNNGSDWDEPSFVGEGVHPSLTTLLLKEFGVYYWDGVYLDSLGLVSAAGTTSVGSDHIVPNRWKYQFLWQPQIPSICLISSASDRGDKLHIGILYGEAGTSNEKIRYRKYEWEEFPDNSWRIISDEIVTSSSSIYRHSYPAITVDLRGVPHIVWEWNWKVYYSTRDSLGNWCSPVQLSSTKKHARTPFIEAHGDYVKVVWDENEDICMKQKQIDTPPSWWSCLVYIRKTNYTSRNPQVAGGENYSWCENHNGNWEVFVDVYNGGVQNISNSFFNDKYSQIDYNSAGYLYCVWTKSGPQGSGVVEKTIPVNRSRYYTVEGGDSVFSKRLIHRDGVATISDYSFDYGYDSLVYNLPFLDSTKLFTIKLTGYSGELSSWNDSISGLTVLIDGKEVDGKSLISSIPTIECEISREMYRKDEELIITLKPEIDEYAMFSGLEIFDSEIPSLNLKGSFEKPVDVGVPHYLKAYPNPTINGRIIIEFGLPKIEKVNLSIYDCTGRHVKKLISKNMTQGVHSISWYGTNENDRKLASGIYFCILITEDIRMTYKIILLK
jgi:hypothetical protein